MSPSWENPLGHGGLTSLSAQASIEVVDQEYCWMKHEQNGLAWFWDRSCLQPQFKDTNKSKQTNDKIHFTLLATVESGIGQPTLQVG